MGEMGEMGDKEEESIFSCSLLPTPYSPIDDIISQNNYSKIK
jgi:hypothetical protein